MYIGKHAEKEWGEIIKGRKHTDIELPESIDLQTSDEVYINNGTVEFMYKYVTDLLKYPMYIYTYGAFNKSFEKRHCPKAQKSVSLHGDLAFLISSYRLKAGEGVFAKFTMPQMEKESAGIVQYSILLTNLGGIEKLDCGWSSGCEDNKTVQIDITGKQYTVSNVCGQHHYLLQMGEYNQDRGVFLWNRQGGKSSHSEWQKNWDLDIPGAAVCANGGSFNGMEIRQGDLLVGKHQGFVYFKPFDFTDYMNGGEIIMLTQGECELQYYNRDRQKWLSYKEEAQLNYENVLFRAAMVSESKIIKMAIAEHA